MKKFLITKKVYKILFLHRNDNLLDDKTPKALKLPNTW